MQKESAIRNPQSAIAVVALGSNLGDSRKITSEAMSRLQEFSDEPIRKSSLWQTTPVNCPAGSPMFVNAVVVFAPRAGETPESLFEKLQSMEKEFGRAPKKVLNEPRPLDLDMIDFGNQTRSTDSLILPHPRAHLRAFVLQPLSEVAPDFIFSSAGKTVSELLNGLCSGELLTKLC